MIHKKILSLLVLLTVASGTWADELQTEYTSGVTLNAVTVSADMEITINKDVTVTINNGLTIATDKTLTVKGPGKLVVNGTNGSRGSDGSMGTGATGGPGSDGGAAITGNIVVKEGATVEATGGYGGEGGTGGGGTYGSNPGPGGKGGKGGKGGAAFTGAVTIFSGTITAKGGSGGDGGHGGHGGINPMDFENPAPDGEQGAGNDSGNAFAGTLTVYGGTVNAKGSMLGYGKPNGTASKAFANDVTINAATYELRGSNSGNNTAIDFADIKNYTDIDIIAADAKDPNGLNVEPVEGKTNQWEFAMIGSDIVLTPVYADAAKFATEGNKVLAPEAVEGVIAGTTDPIITAGETQQGTVMYFATTEQISAEQAAQANGWLAALPTAEGYDNPATVYVWYYIQGADTPEGETATLENTFNNSEICAQPITVNVLDNKFDLTLTPAPVEKATVTINGTAATPDQAGKIEAVKMNSEVKLKANTGYKFRKVEVKKKAAASDPTLAETLTTAGMTVKVNYNYGGENYCTFVSNGDGTYTFQSGGGYVGGDDNHAKALVVENGKLVFKQDYDGYWEYFGFSVTFDTSNNTYIQWKGEYADDYSPSFISVEVNGTQIAVTRQ